MKLHGSLLFAFMIHLLQPVPAQAHFLFIRVLPPAEGGRIAEVYFSELAQAGDPRFIDKIAPTRLWLQKTSGEWTALTAHKTADRLRVLLPAAGSVMVVGQCEYGVLARPKQTPFLLRHFPKALAGNPDEINRLKPYGKLPLEVSATFDGEQLKLVALKDGKPVPFAEFVTVDVDLANTTLKADAQGSAAWKPPSAGVYSVYTRDLRKDSGEYQGKKYDEIRDFATIAFSWPLEHHQADPVAVAQFEEAIAARAQWHNFPGFTAQIRGDLDGRRFQGSVTIDEKGGVLYTDDDLTRGESVGDWIQEQLESITMHRLARPASADRASPKLYFAEPKENHPMGQLLMVMGGKFASSYRIKDRQITVVNRHLGKENMSITVLDNDKTPEGLFLPHSYVVRYWDAANGRLLRTETVQDSWQRVGSLDLPAQHTVTVATDSGLSVRQFSLTKHELVKSKTK